VPQQRRVAKLIKLPRDAPVLRSHHAVYADLVIASLDQPVERSSGCVLIHTVALDSFVDEEVVGPRPQLVQVPSADVRHL